MNKKAILTSARVTLASFFRSILARFKAFLLFSTGMVIMGVLMLEPATIRISLSLSSGQKNNVYMERKQWDEKLTMINAEPQNLGCSHIYLCKTQFCNVLKILYFYLCVCVGFFLC